MRLEGKTVIITGASAGMGQAMTELFVHEGANVVAVARRKERLDALAESLKDGPGKVAVFAGDVGKKEDNEAMIDYAVETFGKLDVLINNAGIMDDNTAIGDMSDEMLDRLMKVDAYGPMYAMRKAVQVFLKQGEGGNIINGKGSTYCRNQEYSFHVYGTGDPLQRDRSGRSDHRYSAGNACGK